MPGMAKISSKKMVSQQPIFFDPNESIFHTTVNCSDESSSSSSSYSSEKLSCTSSSETLKDVGIIWPSKSSTPKCTKSAKFSKTKGSPECQCKLGLGSKKNTSPIKQTVNRQVVPVPPQKAVFPNQPIFRNLGPNPIQAHNFSPNILPIHNKMVSFNFDRIIEIKKHLSSMNRCSSCECQDRNTDPYSVCSSPYSYDEEIEFVRPPRPISWYPNHLPNNLRPFFNIQPIARVCQPQYYQNIAPPNHQKLIMLPQAEQSPSKPQFLTPPQQFHQPQAHQQLCLPHQIQSPPQQPRVFDQSQQQIVKSQFQQPNQLLPNDSQQPQFAAVQMQAQTPQPQFYQANQMSNATQKQQLLHVDQQVQNQPQHPQFYQPNQMPNDVQYQQQIKPQYYQTHQALNNAQIQQPVQFQPQPQYYQTNEAQQQRPQQYVQPPQVQMQKFEYQPAPMGQQETDLQIQNSQQQANYAPQTPHFGNNQLQQQDPYLAQQLDRLQQQIQFLNQQGFVQQQVEPQQQIMVQEPNQQMHQQQQMVPLLQVSPESLQLNQQNLVQPIQQSIKNLQEQLARLMTPLSHYIQPPQFSQSHSQQHQHLLQVQKQPLQQQKDLSEPLNVQVQNNPQLATSATAAPNHTQNNLYGNFKDMKGVLSCQDVPSSLRNNNFQPLTHQMSQPHLNLNQIMDLLNKRDQNNLNMQARNQGNVNDCKPQNPLDFIKLLLEETETGPSRIRFKKLLNAAKVNKNKYLIEPKWQHLMNGGMELEKPKSSQKFLKKESKKGPMYLFGDSKILN